MNRDAGLLREDRQDLREKSRVLHRSRRCESDRGGGLRTGSALLPEQGDDRQQQDVLPNAHRLSSRTNAVALTAMLIPINRNPSPRANPKSPSLVFSTMAVVIVLV